MITEDLHKIGQISEKVVDFIDAHKAGILLTNSKRLQITACWVGEEDEVKILIDDKWTISLDYDSIKGAIRNYREDRRRKW